MSSDRSAVSSHASPGRGRPGEAWHPVPPRPGSGPLVSSPPVLVATAIIPARYASQRFPGKVLADRTGKPLIQHVHEQVCRANLVERVIVAADDRRIIDAVMAFGGEAVMTREDHPNGTSRIAEVASGMDAGLVVNVQADEPDIEPALIDTSPTIF